MCDEAASAATSSRERRESHPLCAASASTLHSLAAWTEAPREGGPTAEQAFASSPLVGLLPDAKNVTVPHGSLRRCASSISSSAMQRRQRRRHGRVLKVQCQRRPLSLGATMMGRDRRRRPASWTILQKAEMINRRRGLISVRDALGRVARSDPILLRLL